jgi:hypothetical protein
MNVDFTAHQAFLVLRYQPTYGRVLLPSVWANFGLMRGSKVAATRSP